MSSRENEAGEERPLDTAGNFQDLETLVMAGQLGYDVTEWNEEGILDVIKDVKDLVEGVSDTAGKAGRANKEGALKNILDRLPNDGDLGILKTKLAKFAKLEK